ncbi:protoporphyrinogen oxidase HemJ [Acidocella facilis]|uniref:protoporphyrinogen oxidase HemJ n=1 Tax=Acidocella facilis TaxID=525 RepID=UPI002E184D31
MSFPVLLPFFKWFLALHIMSFTAWMAGMFYLPRLYVYHCQTRPGSVESERFKVMERRLLKQIINPAMISTFIFGVLLVLTPGAVSWSAGWWWTKIVALVLMFGFHGACSRWRRDFLNDSNRRAERFYRIANEVPTILFIVIVIAVVVKP